MSQGATHWPSGSLAGDGLARVCLPVCSQHLHQRLHQDRTPVEIEAHDVSSGCERTMLEIAAREIGSAGAHELRCDWMLRRARRLWIAFCKEYGSRLNTVCDRWLLHGTSLRSCILLVCCFVDLESCGGRGGGADSSAAVWQPQQGGEQEQRCTGPFERAVAVGRTHLLALMCSGCLSSWLKHHTSSTTISSMRHPNC